MVVRKRSDLELSEDDFVQMLALLDVLDEMQLLRLQCKISSLIGDPLPEGEGKAGDTEPPPRGLGGPYAREEADSYEDLAEILEPEDEDGGV
jgi:hypothetical protein